MEEVKFFLARLESVMENDDCEISKSFWNTFHSNLEYIERLENEDKINEYGYKYIQVTIPLLFILSLYNYCNNVISKYQGSENIYSKELILDKKLIGIFLQKIDLYFTKSELFCLLQLFDDTSIRRVLNCADSHNFDNLYYSVRSQDLAKFLSQLKRITSEKLSAIIIEAYLKSDRFFTDVKKYYDENPNRFKVIVYNERHHLIDFLEYLKKYESEDTLIITKDRYNVLVKKAAPLYLEMKKIIYDSLDSKYIPQIIKKDLKDVVIRYNLLFDSLDNTLLLESTQSFDNLHSSDNSLQNEDLEMIVVEIVEILNNLLKQYKQPLTVTQMNIDGNTSNLSEGFVTQEKFDLFLNDNFEISYAERKHFDLNYKSNLLTFVKSIKEKKLFESFCYLLYPNNTTQRSGKDYSKGKIEHLQGGLTWKIEPGSNIDCAKRLCKYFPLFTKYLNKGNKFTYNQSQLKDIIVNLVVDTKIYWIEKFIKDYWALQSEEKGKSSKNPRTYVCEEIKRRKKSVRD